MLCLRLGNAGIMYRLRVWSVPTSSVCEFEVAGRDILNSIDREMSGDLKEGMKALVMSAKNRPEYFADRLDDAMRGAGTKDSTLIRVIVSRSEIDLQDIKEVYLFKYHKTVATAVRSDTGGDYKRLLLALVGQ